jgi:Uma2 family endonuclease
MSPNDVIYEVSEKVIEYRAARFPLVWVVDPMQQIVTVYPNPGKPFLLSQDDIINAPDALPGFSCKVSELFPAE